MSKSPDSNQIITDLIRHKTVVTLPEVHTVLGPVSHRTVCRKLVEAGVHSSYSHRGRYYTLEELIEYDVNGLWSYNDIHFSRNGTLKETLVRLIHQSEAGLFLQDLRKTVKREVLGALNGLIQTKRIAKTKLHDQNLYVSKHASRRKRQLRNRTVPEIVDPVYERARKDLMAILDERQRRLFAGLESLRPESGGDQQVAIRLGMARSTVSTGRKQLLSGEFEKDRIRRFGGGRKSVKKKP